MTDQPEVIPSEQRDTKAEDAKIAAVNIEGRKIFDDFINRQKKDRQFAQLDPQSKYEYYIKAHPDFARSNPVILRYITLGLFHEKAVYLYYQQCYRIVTKSDTDFAERSADYIKYLYHFTTKIRGAELDKIWSDTKQLLLEELDEIAKEREKIKAERASRQSSSDDVRREAFKAAIVKAITAAKEKVATERLVDKIAELETATAGLSVSDTTEPTPAPNGDVNALD